MTREEAIKQLKGIVVGAEWLSEYMVEALDMAIKALEQEPKTGHWIESNIPNEKYVCSECGGGCWYYDYQADVVKSRFCPNCGTKMESEEI